MGRDKAALETDGQSLLACSIRALQEAELSVLVVGRSGATTPGLSYCEDDIPGQGPLGGIITALRQAQGRAIFVVPCDVPALRSAAVRWLLSCWRTAPADVCAAQRGDYPEPLFAIYASQVLPIFERQLANGQASVMKAIAAVATTTVALPPEHLGAVSDVDTPADWQQFRKRD
jgi:molybdenum cofactor guanylyltransferase